MFRLALLTATAIAAGAVSHAHADPQLGSATLPGARAGAVGDTLTVFGALANAGDTTATSCAPAVTGFSGSFAYRAVASDNQSFSAPQDTPVDIAAGQTQNFLLSFTAASPLEEEEVDLVFDCANAAPAPRIDGVNSVLITAETVAGADILPVIVTPSNDGVVRIPALGRAQAASIAAANIGAGGEVDVVVSADMGDLLGEPLSLAICETGSDGRCVDSFGNPAPTPPPPGQTAINARVGNSASTFSVFAYADREAGVRFNPDLSRVNVRFHEYEAPGLAPGGVSSPAIAARPDGAATELSGVSSAAQAPGRPPRANEFLPRGVFEAVFDTADGRGEGVLIAGPDGAIAGGFRLRQTEAPFAEFPFAVFGTAAPAATGRIRAEDARLYGLSSDTPSVPYTLRGPFEPDHYMEGALEPSAGSGQPRILFRGQWNTLSHQSLALASLSGPHQVIANGVPLGYANLDGGAIDGFLSDGSSMDANCLVTGSLTHADPVAQSNFLDAAVSITTAPGQAACTAAATGSGLGFRSDRPRPERGAVTRNVVTAYLEEPNRLGAVEAQFRPILDTGFTVRRVASGLSQALFVAGLPEAAGRILVVRKTGQVHIVDPVTGTVDPDLFMDVSGSISTAGEGGLVGLALAPDFSVGGSVYVYVTNPAGDTEIRRYATRAGDPDQVDPATLDVILTFDQPEAFHNGGWIGFGPDNFLYIASGDGGGVGDPYANAQNPNTLLGAILRIDPSTDAYPGDASRDYAIPAGNPYAAGGGAPEIWAIGLRNPYRASFDTETGDLIIADVGQGEVEEIDIIPAGVGGLNFGWPLREGTQPYEGGANSASFTGPVADYLHGTGPYRGNSVTGGYVYRGDIAALDGHYVFADFVRGNIWSIPVEYLDPARPVPAPGLIHRNQDFTPDAGAIGNVSSFGVDRRGALYIVDYDGEIFRIEAE